MTAPTTDHDSEHSEHRPHLVLEDAVPCQFEEVVRCSSCHLRRRGIEGSERLEILGRALAMLDGVVPCRIFPSRTSTIRLAYFFTLHPVRASR